MSYSRAKYPSAKRPVPFFVWASPHSVPDLPAATVVQGHPQFL